MSKMSDYPGTQTYNFFMRKFELLLICSLLIFAGTDLYCYESFNYESKSLYLERQDTLEKQILFNGRVWRNLYHHVREDQYLFTNKFLPGTVTFNDKLFKNISIRYDIYNDEILTTTDHGIILQLNKEMVDKFTMEYENKTYLFQKLETDSLNVLIGYVNVLNGGRASLFVKYKKEILILAVENKYDTFHQLHRIYIRKDGIAHPINSRKELIGLLSDKKQQIKNFIKSNKIHLSKKIPESYVPVVEFYNTSGY